MQQLKDKSVVCFGGTGFVGRHVVDILQKRGADVWSLGSRDIDLRFPDLSWDDGTELKELFGDWRPDYAINLAAYSGGFLFNAKNPSKIFSRNLEIGMGAMDLANFLKVKRNINVATSCSYGDGEPVLKEENFHRGIPHESVAYFAAAKRSIDIYGRALRKENGFNTFTIIGTNIFGPGDTTDLTKCKMVGSLIMKFLKGKTDNAPYVQLLGTGQAKREILFVRDAAELIVRALERYEDPTLPLNIGRSTDWSIKEIALSISRLVGYEGEIRWEDSENGQMSKLLDHTRMYEHLEVDSNFYTPLMDGLQITIEDYKLRLGV